MAGDRPGPGGRLELDVVATNRHWMARRTLPAAGQERGQARAVLRLPAVADPTDTGGGVPGSSWVAALWATSGSRRVPRNTALGVVVVLLLTSAALPPSPGGPEGVQLAAGPP